MAIESFCWLELPTTPFTPMLTPQIRQPPLGAAGKLSMNHLSEPASPYLRGAAQLPARGVVAPVPDRVMFSDLIWKPLRASSWHCFGMLATGTADCAIATWLATITLADTASIVR